MPIPLDPELAALADAQVAEAVAAGSTLPARGDVAALRAMAEVGMTIANARVEAAPDVTVQRDSVTASDDAEIELRWYRSDGADPDAAIVYAHGGGMVSGSLDIFDPVLRQYARWSGMPIVGVEYRIAPKATGETPARDVLAAVRHVIDAGVARVAVMGDSAGGGIAAGAAILARDAGLTLSRQILIYPMLDDRTVDPDPLLAHAFWDYDMNHTGWSALLGDLRGADAVSPVAAPGRLTDFSGLAPAYIEVGTVDIFRDESIRYAQGLLAAGIDAELHLHPGAPHTYDTMAPLAAYADRWKADRIRAMRF